MKIEINYSPENQNYIWSIYDGPDGIDYTEGCELDLGQCFEQIIKFRLMNSLTYAEDDVDLKRTISAYFNSLNQK